MVALNGHLLVLHVWFVFGVGFAGAGFQPSLFWDPRNPIFQQNVEIKVPLHSKLNIVCPNPASVLDEQDSSIPQEQMYENMWMVDKHEYDTCTVNTSVTSVQSFSTNKKLLSCNSPLQLKYYEMAFRSYIAPGSFAYEPGKKYYFIATSDGTSESLSNHEGGRCLSSNMKLIIYVCNGSSDPQCNGDQNNLFPSSVFCSAPIPTVSSCQCPTPSSTVIQSSPTSNFQSVAPTISASPTSTALALKSSTAANCLASIPEEFFSIFANQTNQLSAIYNYTHMIPDVRLLLEQILNQSTRVNQQGKTEQETNTTQNCTEQQSNQQASQDVLVVMKETPVLKNCKELHDAGYTISGSYRLDPSEGNALSRFRAYCDQDTAGGGWTVWMRRFDGFLSFDRDWEAYFNGFGDLSGEFWLGLRKMRQACAQDGQTFRIRFDLEAADGSKTYAEYTNCTMDDWSRKFKLTVGPFVGGAAGDSLSYHNNMKFTTSDRDNDKNSDENCAQLANGGWWFNDCQKACLTGSYENGTHSQAGVVGIQWFSWKGANYSLSRVEMKAKPT